MNENQQAAADVEIEDVQGHRVGPKVDGPEDVEGHRVGPKVDGPEDVEGHRLAVPHAEADEADDVSGHVQPRRDLDIER
jgi:hypothetical protein